MDITTDRLRLRPPRLDDGEACVAYLDDPDTARMLARVPQPYRLEDWQTFYDSVADGQEELVFALTFPEEDRLIGITSLIPTGQSAILGYWIGAPYRRRGLMSEAVAGLLGKGFGEMGLTHVDSGYFFDNSASARLQAKLGFRITGRSEAPCPARGALVPHIDTLLKKEQFVPE